MYDVNTKKDNFSFTHSIMHPASKLYYYFQPKFMMMLFDVVELHVCCCCCGMYDVNTKIAKEKDNFSFIHSFSVKIVLLFSTKIYDDVVDVVELNVYCCCCGMYDVNTKKKRKKTTLVSSSVKTVFTIFNQNLFIYLFT